jgi:RNA 2',3'-cyclic 3'-phosphodiesterase
MRLFAALPIPEPACSEMARLLQGLRQGDWPVRWVHEDNIHLTLKFFGEVPPDRLDVIAEALQFAVAGTGPLALSLAEPGVFPTLRRPRVVWVGVDAPPALELLQDRLERRFEAIGFPPEGGPYHPHLTLGRVREEHRLPAGALEQLQGGYQAVSFMVDQLVLYESIGGRGAPRYTPRVSLELAA